MSAVKMLAELWPIAILVFVVVVLYRRRSRVRSRVGPGAIGAVYDLLNEDKRNAVELIVEQRAEEIRPEYADGNLPDLANTRQTDAERRTPDARRREPNAKIPPEVGG